MVNLSGAAGADVGTLAEQLVAAGYNPIVTPVAATADRVHLTGAAMSPKLVEPGDLFVAVTGARAHGADFIQEVIDRGAAAVLTDPAGVVKVREAAGYRLPVIEVAGVRDAAGPAAAAIYGTTATSDPALFGVTGTNGKTTTTYFLRSLLRAVLTPQGRETGLIGTIEIAAGQERIASEMTTPEAVALHKLMHSFRGKNVAAAAMEVSSHAISYQRISGLYYDVAGFTNLTQDHLDLHGTMEDYFAAKADLFRRARTRTSVITVDDAAGHQMAAEATGHVVTLSTNGQPAQAHWEVSEVEPAGLGSAFTLANRHTGERIRTSTALPGAFNVSNAALAAVMVLEAAASSERTQAFHRQDVVEALQTAQPFHIQVPGRMQVIAEQPAAIVDFAHNPDAMIRALEAVRRPTGRLILVIGAAGERDATKRPTMGAIAVRMADHVIISDDDPHGEDPAEIRAGLLNGARDAIATGGLSTTLEEISPRADAIAAAVAAAEPEDTILLAGRGHEVHQDVAGTRVEIDDREELARTLKAKGFATLDGGA
ncbi:UDP-N-acetylmuramoyl-L-alanyl-D-glutamate--2,6-diaminopimelate ligase [Nesterenkonia salmonea]|uniref:UDP-N-acetylmuramyl-tripeptide synthetase n=1 Tax=Nesterenkonia salmonea TaxID=1804987 RepID=A0A5R9BE22_9MICC|nr:UDP-N-acetylmuramoyl-L-alanyl-D-glutamate--2,6-diaminopimelate ligase [Nesterenkonia salmonea]TLP98352.1 UDP-N-acetylmuramoyl-L-alanyl-D-glutamate--2,6-diaminopimelate ligase [Nesterenkonia salmonea]